MAGATADLLRHVHQLMAVHADDQFTDRQLLERFASTRDEAAFALLVRRHGPMVLGVCRRVLHHEQDAEDAFQAVFLILARKAGAIRRAEVGGFLYRVAYNLAIRARGDAAKRKQHDKRRATMPALDPMTDTNGRDVRDIVDEELQRLPEALRSAVVLCYLEGKTHEEAARLLGWSKGTLRRRLGQGRELLRTRLVSRGMAPMAALTATLFAEGGATAAVPSALAGAVVGAALGSTTSPAVAALVEVGSELLGFGKKKLAALIVLVMSLLTGAGVGAHRGLAEPPAETAKRPAEKPKEARPSDRVVLTGRVLDADGKPVKGARLFSPHVRKFPPRGKGDFALIARGATDGEGRFTIELPRCEFGPLWLQTLIAAADGHGVDWADLPSDKLPTELTLRLPREQPIQGRILNTEGKPAAGAVVGVVRILAMDKKQLDALLAEWKQDWRETTRGAKVLWMSPDKVLGSVRTDAEGRFRIAGVGAHHVAVLWAKGSGIADGSMIVVNRAGFDPAALNRAVQAGIPESARLPGQPPILYGPKLDYVAAAPRPIEGTVRASGDGKPIAGIRVWSSIGSGYDDTCSAVTDKDGHYRLAGLPKMKQVLLHAEDPDENSTWLQGGARVPDRKRFEPLRVDLTLARGVLVTGRVTDKATGKGVLSAIHFVPLRENTFFNKPGYNAFDVSRGGTQTDEKGRFRLMVIPGPGVLMAQAAGMMTELGQRINPYKTAEFDAHDRERVKVLVNGAMRYFVAAGDRTEGLDGGHAVKYLNVAPDAGPMTCDLRVDSGRTLTVKVQGPDGEPLMGAIAAGLTVSIPTGITLKGSTCTVYALDPENPRPLMFVHRQRQLIGMTTVRGDEKESPVVQLDRAGSMTGRVVDEEGRPVVGAAVFLAIPKSAKGDDVRRLLDQLKRDEPRTRTDKDGRFRLECLLPDQTFSLLFQRGNSSLLERLNSRARQVKGGETLDLGDIRVKPSR